MSLFENAQPQRAHRLCLHLVKNGAGKLVGGRVTAHVACPDAALCNDIVDSL